MSIWSRKSLFMRVASWDVSVALNGATFSCAPLSLSYLYFFGSWIYLFRVLHLIVSGLGSY